MGEGPRKDICQATDAHYDITGGRTVPATLPTAQGPTMFQSDTAHENTAEYNLFFCMRLRRLGICPYVENSVVC